MVGSWSKFRLLIWKNWKLQIRHPIQTAFEILVPVFFCIILVIVRSLIESTVEEPSKFNSFEVSQRCAKLNKTVLAFSPHPQFIKTAMQQVAFYTETKNPFRGLNDATSLEHFLVSLPEPNRGIGIVFPEEYAHRTSFPHKVEFTLRFPSEINRQNSLSPDVRTWQTNLLYPQFQEPGPRHRYADVASPDYLGECFLALQSAVSRAIIESVNPKMVDNWPTISMQRFPYPSFIYDILIVILKSMIALIIVLAFEYTAISIIKVITAEKEKQLKESMKIMGLSGTLHWAAWFTKSLLFMLISILIMVALMKIDVWYADHIPAVLPKCDSFILFLFLFLYSITVITLCFAISVFFTRANMAAGIGGSIFFLFVLPASLLEKSYEEIGLGTKLGVSPMSNTALSYGFRLICMFESTGEGLHWGNFFRPVTSDDDLTMAHIFLMLIIDAIFYMCIALYVEAVFPGKFGVRKPWHFIFTIWFRRNHRHRFAPNRSELDPHNFEVEPRGKAGIDVRGLTKCYGDKIAVDNMQLRMYEDQITVLLGHNGAGKTTTMSMLTGMETPTSGTAMINHFDLRTNIEQVRSSLGLCPQHNILFDELTVTEHIYFFSRLKGVENSRINGEIDKFLELLQMTDKRDAPSSTLSGGMKRKLSVAVAFCGGSKVVMLDEPTAGMDPGARRALWELVESQKTGRTIMLTTHFMDEADLLGDRIAIMGGGQLRCCGSSFFLKKRYGAGYHLVIEKLAHCNVDQVTRTMQRYIPHIQVESNIGSELSYSLNENDTEHFEAMLGNVESNLSHLGIGSYGISLTTLEEVFMKVGALDTHHHQHISNDQRPSEVRVKIDLNLRPNLVGWQLLLNQVLAMMLKRVLSTVRSWPLLLAQIVIPVLMLIIAVIAGRQTNAKELPNRAIQLREYHNPVTLLKYDDPGNMFYLSAKQWLTSNRFAIERVDDVEKYMLQKTEQVPGQVRMSYIIGAEFSKKHIHGWFNNDPFHSPPLILNFIYNSISRNIIDGPMLEIEVNNHPLPLTITSKLKQLQQGNNIGFQLAINLGFCMAFISAFYILFYIRERVCKVKHLQFVSGVNIGIFWGLSYLWDWMTYLITIGCLIVTLLCFQEDGFKSAQDIGNLILIFAYFGFAMLPLIYLLSFLYELPATGFTRVILFATLFGVFAFIIVEILSAEALDLQDVGKALDWVFLFIPQYDLSSAIRATNLEYQRYKACNKIAQICIDMCTGMGIPRDQCVDTCWKSIQANYKDCQERTEQYYVWNKPGILRNIVFAFSVGVALIMILLLLEFKVFHYIYYKLQRPRADQVLEELDDDVSFEKKKISLLNSQEIGQHNLVLRGMTKFYKNFQAVKGLNLSVNQYECFGLLGVNGAGKTTSFRMITGDTSISSGDVFVKGLNLKQQIKDVYKQIGYCPQFDALFDDLTGRETIMVFALLRGYSRSECDCIAEQFSHDFDFYPHLDKKVREMSGGNKRKLSTAVAFIGDPPIVYLDEPSTGMDPATKRHLWNALCRIRDEGKCLILTTHSMEECEALCTRLAIMVNGQFKCLGSPQHLKNKFARGFTLTIKIKKRIDYRENLLRVAQFVIAEFPTAVLREQHQEMITYYISDSALPWSKMFGVIERAKNELQIEDYFLGQSSLEQVFLKFTQLVI